MKIADRIKYLGGELSSTVENLADIAFDKYSIIPNNSMFPVHGATTADLPIQGRMLYKASGTVSGANIFYHIPFRHSSNFSVEFWISVGKSDFPSNGFGFLGQTGSDAGTTGATKFKYQINLVQSTLDFAALAAGGSAQNLVLTDALGLGANITMIANQCIDFDTVYLVHFKTTVTNLIYADLIGFYVGFTGTTAYTGKRYVINPIITDHVVPINAEVWGQYDYFSDRIITGGGQVSALDRSGNTGLGYTDNYGKSNVFTGNDLKVGISDLSTANPIISLTKTQNTRTLIIQAASGNLANNLIQIKNSGDYAVGTAYYCPSDNLEGYFQCWVDTSQTGLFYLISNVSNNQLHFNPGIGWFVKGAKIILTAVSNNPLVEIVDYDGTKVCFRFFKKKTIAFILKTIGSTAIPRIDFISPSFTVYPTAPKHLVPTKGEHFLSNKIGKKLVLIGDSNQSTLDVQKKLSHDLSLNVFDAHWIGHHMRYETGWSAVPNNTMQWFYSQYYRNSILARTDLDYYLFVFSSNEGKSYNIASETISEGGIQAVKDNYPYLGDDATAISNKLALFNAMGEATKETTFNYVSCMCSFVDQILTVNPNAKIIITSAELTLGGTYIASRGVWQSGQNASTAYAGVNQWHLDVQAKVQQVVARYPDSCYYIDLFLKSRITYENFANYTEDGTHWYEMTSQSSFNSPITQDLGIVVTDVIKNI